MSKTAFVQYSTHRVFRLKGKDALDLIQRLSTNDVLPAKNGAPASTFLTTEKGKIVDLITLIHLQADEYLGIGRRDSIEKTIRWIEKFIIMEEATVEKEKIYVSQYVVFSDVVDISRFKSAITEELLKTDAGGTPTIVMFEESFGTSGLLTVLASGEHRNAVTDSFKRKGVQESDSKVLRDFCILSGIPQGDFELTESVNPLESGLHLYVSFTKGCYIGQEVIARIDTYKKLQRSLTAFLLPEPTNELPARIEADGREAGTITGAVFQKGGGAVKAIGYLHTGIEDSELICISSGHSFPVLRHERILWTRQ